MKQQPHNMKAPDLFEPNRLTQVFNLHTGDWIRTVDNSASRDLFSDTYEEPKPIENEKTNPKQLNLF